VLRRGVRDPVQVVGVHLLVDRVARRPGNSVEVAQLCGVFGDEPLTVLLAQRLPPLLDVLGGGTRRWQRYRPRLGRHVDDVIGPVHRSGQLLIDRIRLRQNPLDRLLQHLRVMPIVGRGHASKHGTDRARHRIDHHAAVAGHVQHLLEVVLDDLDVDRRCIGRARRRQCCVGVPHQRLTGLLERLLGFLGAGTRPVREFRQLVGGVDRRLCASACGVADLADRTGTPALYIFDRQRHSGLQACGVQRSDPVAVVVLGPCVSRCGTRQGGGL
jgi:hypothetical protein